MTGDSVLRRSAETGLPVSDRTRREVAAAILEHAPSSFELLGATLEAIGSGRSDHTRPQVQLLGFEQYVDVIRPCGV